MGKLNIEYSKKNIPVSSKHQNQIILILKIEKVVKRMRWKVLEFYGKPNDNNKETFGFRSIKRPPCVPELSDFESELTLMVNNIEFRNINDDFQKKIKNDINQIKTCNPIQYNTVHTNYVHIYVFIHLLINQTYFSASYWLNLSYVLAR